MVKFNHKSHVSLCSRVTLKQILLGREELLSHEAVHAFFQLSHLIIDLNLVRVEMLDFSRNLQLIERAPSHAARVRCTSPVCLDTLDELLKLVPRHSHPLCHCVLEM